jgi:hypothetical protein
MAGDTVTIQGRYSGSRQNLRERLVSGQMVGPYYGEIVLPQPLNGVLPNVTFGHAVLVLAMPTLQPGRPGSDTAYEREVVEATRGQRLGYTGSDVQRLTTEEQRHKMKQIAQEADGSEPGFRPSRGGR